MTRFDAPPRPIAALVVAAGEGVRAGRGMPKQYRVLGDRAVIRHTVERFFECPGITRLRVVFNDEHRSLYDHALGELLSDPRLLPPVSGGASRQDSVRLGLESLREVDPEIVLIHDAVRPLVTPRLVADVIDAASKPDAAGAIPALPVVDTLKRGNGGRVDETVDRTDLWRAQTPQAFRYREILAAHLAAKGQTLTDDAAVAELAGLAVAIVAGDPDNIKFTTREDFDAAGAAPSRSEIRVGTGFDVHRFGPGDHVVLCGVTVPHDRGLVGHSDADAGLHALTDALLGAMGLGDIGDHFPPTDERWRDSPSDLFLKHARDLAARGGGTILNLDLTLICERPVIKPYRDAMRARVADILELDPSRVSVKATTTEKLGFAGRGEGIAAQAVASVRVKTGSA